MNLVRDVSTQFALESDTAKQVACALSPGLRSNLYTAIGNAAVASGTPVDVYAFRVVAALFGSNAPLQAVTNDKGVVKFRKVEIKPL